MLMAQAPGSHSLTSVLGPCAPEGSRMRSHGLWGARVVSLPPVGSGSPHVSPQVIVILCVAARAHVGDPVLAGHPRRIKNQEQDNRGIKDTLVGEIVKKILSVEAARSTAMKISC